MVWWEPTDLFRQLYTVVLQQNNMLQQLLQGQDDLMTSSNETQAKVDELTARVTASDDAIQAAVADLRAQIAALPDEVDTSALEAAVAKLESDAASDSSTPDPAPPAPVDPEPEPVDPPPVVPTP